jgi:hypothetical protein
MLRLAAFVAGRESECLEFRRESDGRGERRLKSGSGPRLLLALVVSESANDGAVITSELLCIFLRVGKRVSLADERNEPLSTRLEDWLRGSYRRGGLTK